MRESQWRTEPNSTAAYLFETRRSPRLVSSVCKKLESGPVVSVNQTEIEHLNDHSTKFFALESKNEAVAQAKITLPTLVEIRRKIIELTQTPRDFALDAEINAAADLRCERRATRRAV